MTIQIPVAAAKENTVGANMPPFSVRAATFNSLLNSCNDYAKEAISFTVLIGPVAK